MTLKKTGTYKWVKSKNNGAPIKLNVTCEVKEINKTEVKKATIQMPHKPLHFSSVILKDVNTHFKKQAIHFKSHAIKANAIESAPKFLFRDNAEANITYTDKAHGFIANTSFDITEDAAHNMWIITDAGLVKYDGLKYYLYNTESGLPTLSCMSMVYDNQGRIWINTEEGFFYIKNDSCFVPDIKAIDPKEFHGRNISKDNKNRIWISSSNKGVICINNDNTFSILDKNAGLPTNDVGDIAFLDNKVYLALFEEGLLIMEDNQWRHLKINDEHSISDPFRNAILSVLSVNDTLYFGTWAKGFGRICSKDSVLYSVGGIFNERIFRIVKTDNGIAYGIYGNGVVLQSANRTAHFNRQKGLVGNSAFSVFYDSFKNLWVCDMARGISRINENVLYKSQNPNDLSKISHIRYSPDKKHKWLFFNGDFLTEETDSSFIRYALKINTNRTSLEFVLDGYVNEDNEIWGANYANSGICKIVGNKAYFYFTSEVDQERIFYNVAASNDDKLWFSNDKMGLVYYDVISQNFYQKNITNGTLSNSCAAVKNIGNDLVSFYDVGMQKIEQTNFLDFYINDTLCAYKINDVVKLPSGEILLPTDSKGLLILKGNDVFSLNTSNGLVSNNAKGAYYDGKYVWVFTNKGIERIALKNNTITFNRLFDTNYGLFINEMFGFCQKNQFGGPQIITTTVFDYHPENECKNEALPILNLSKVFINDVEADMNNKLELSASDKLSINYKFINWGHENEFTHFAVLNLDNNDTASFQIGDLGEVKLTELIPGEYTVRVLLKKQHGKFYSSPIKFIIKPYWYNAWWFRLLLAVCLMLVFLYLYKRKQTQNDRLEEKVKKQTERLRQEKIELEEKNEIIQIQNKEKDALIQEVHHRVKNNLQIINAMLKMQLNSIDDESKKVYLKEASRRINAMSLVHEMLYNKDASEYVVLKDYLIELTEKLKELVSYKNKPVILDLHVNAEIKFNTTQCVAIGMITSEITSNAIKHAFHFTAEPKITIHLSISSEKDFLTYTINDNGSGVDDSNKKEGLGTRLIDIFARQIEAEYVVRHTNGVEYEFKIPYIADDK